MSKRHSFRVLLISLAFLTTSSFSGRLIAIELDEDQAGQFVTTVAIDDLLLELPEGVQLASFGLDSDYENVVVLRYHLTKHFEREFAVIIKRSQHPQQWRLVKGAQSLDQHGLLISDQWTVYQTSGLALTEKNVAGFYDSHYHVMVIAIEPLAVLQRLTQRR